MSSYKPQVTCRGAISRVGDAASSFHALARFLPASVTERVFGVDVKLPWQQTGPSTTPGRRPLSVVLQTSPFAAAYRDTAAWWDVYAAVAAIWAMCGELGKGGLAEDIGICFPFLSFSSYIPHPSIPPKPKQLKKVRTILIQTKNITGHEKALTVELKEAA